MTNYTKPILFKQLAFFMIKFSIFIFTLLISTSIFSQKVMEKQINISGVERIEFLADAIYKIKITSIKTNTLVIRATVAGDAAENVVLELIKTPTSLTITPGFTPFFKLENDKLAAHKVMAIELEVLLPENLNVSVSSKMASLQCFGNFNYLQAYLEQGDCELKSFNGDGVIQTKNGDVTVNASQDVGVLAISKTGLVIGKPYQDEYHKLEIKTVSGAITILETN